VQLALLGDELLVAAPGMLGALGLGEAKALGPVEPSRVGSHEPRAIEDLHLGLGLADLELTTDVASWHLEAESMHVDVALEVGDPGMDPINGRAPGR
jgi:hypothetical protein